MATKTLIQVLVFLLLAAAPAHAARVVVFGDSWGVPAAGALQTVLNDLGHSETVANAAVGGETAANLSSASGLQHITDSLTANPEANLVDDSLDHLIGTWSDAESDEFTRAVDDFERIDDGLWK